MEIRFMLLLLILLILSKEDVQNYYLENRTLLILILLAMGEGIVRFCFGNWDHPFEIILYESMLLIWKTVSKGKMGGGDLIVLAALGLYLPVIDLWIGIMGAFILLLPAALLLWSREKNTKAALPFLPFLTGGILMSKVLKWIR